MNMALKKYLIYYLDKILAIQFFIRYWFFAPYLIYVLVWYYSTNKLENPQLDNKNKQIYEKMYIVNWW